jgi:hypothetical protein
MKGFRKTVALILTAMMVASMFPVSSALAADFRDTSGHWAEGTIDTWAGNGVLNGADGSFRPDAPITRAELAAVLNRVVGYNVAGQNLFSDVAATDWFYQDVLKLNSAGVMLGSDGNANPQRLITREEAAVLVARAFEVAGNSAGNDFPDAARVSSWAGELVGGLKQIGYISGKETGNFEPAAHITRAEAVKIIDNIISAFYSKAGEYSDKATGNAVVRASGVTLLNASVGGKLYIMEGVGDGSVTIDGTTVSQETYVRGGGVNSIIIRGNSKLNGLFIRKKEPGPVRVFVEGAGANPGNVRVLEAAGGARIEGTVATVAIETATDVTFSGGTVGELAITANNARAVVDASSQITRVNSTGDNVTITGTGNVTSVYVDDGDGVTVNVPNATVVVAADAGEVKTGDNKVIAPGTTGRSEAPTGTTEVVEAGGGGGGGGGGGIVINQFLDSVAVGGEDYIEAVDNKVYVVEGKELTALAKTKEGNAIARGVSYKWQYATAADATEWTQIPDATSDKYTPADFNDVVIAGKFIRVEATGTSGARGTVYSKAMQVDQAGAKVIGSVEIENRPYVNAPITAVVKDGRGRVISAGLTYEWKSTTDNPEETSPTWSQVGSNAASYTLATAGVWIRVNVTGDDTAASGTEPSNAIGPVENGTAIDTVTIGGDVTVGNPNPITAVVMGSSKNLTEFATYKWEYGNDPDWTEIPDVVGRTLKLADVPAAVVGMNIRVTATGNNVEATSSQVSADAGILERPGVYDINRVEVTGTEEGTVAGEGVGAKENTTITATAYKDGTNEAAPGVEYTWSISSSNSGPWTKVADGATYTLQYGNVGKYLMASAKGDGYYVSTTEVKSTPVKIVTGVHGKPKVGEGSKALEYSNVAGAHDVEVTINLGAGQEIATRIDSIKQGNDTLTVTTHYTLNDNTLTLKEEYIEGIIAGTAVGTIFTFTVTFNNNENANSATTVVKKTTDTFTLKVNNTTQTLADTGAIEISGIGKNDLENAFYIGAPDGSAYEVSEAAYNLLEQLKDDTDSLSGLAFTFDGGSKNITAVNVVNDVALDAGTYTIGTTGDGADVVIPALTVKEDAILTIPANAELTVQEGAAVDVAAGATVTVSNNAKMTFDDDAVLSGEGTVAVAAGGTFENDNGNSIWGDGDVAIEINAGAMAKLGGDTLVGDSTAIVELTDGEIILKKDVMTLPEGSAATLNGEIYIGTNLVIAGELTAGDGAKIVVASGKTVEINNGEELGINGTTVGQVEITWNNKWEVTKGNFDE